MTIDLAYILPPGLTFWQGLQKGLVPTLESPAYLEWVRSLPCVITGAKGVTAHHLVGHGLKGAGDKTGDLLTFPLSPEYHLPNYPEGLHCLGHREWERRHDDQRVYVLQTLLQAVYDGVLTL